ncbi:hypothetical protein G7Z17_g2535 [Cylindrodendrum hubeiense]|uniref:Heterokaryon incompatibility domain-containing protein n=1 Tax=Cylindrodendrum hubeiense TaxID=595255 RepID=A0A9P5LBI8_9HYPO|nr:hypothetical protein G7Z17_g2535 [Cylindrodendrum hubeiense]
MFNYSPLNRHHSEIRLVRFVESPDASTQLQLELCHSSLNDTKFSALSYLWGDCTETVDVSLNGHQFTIGLSLHAGLKQLRENGFQSWIWIDSICIQQQDLEEKNWHVQEMGTVYGQAECVYMWLGLGSDATDRAMDFMSLIGPKLVDLCAMDILNSTRNALVGDYVRSRSSGTDFDSIRDPAAMELACFMYELLQYPGVQAEAVLGGETIVAEGNTIQGFREIINRDYSHRIWVIQEVALAKVGIVLCGTKSLSLEHFESSFMALWDCRCWDVRPKQQRVTKMGFEWSWNWLLPLSTRRRTRYWTDRPLQLAEILHQTFKPTFNAIYAASDPRDIIFGLLGVIEDREELDLHVDYNLSMAEVFIEVTKAFLQNANNTSAGYRYGLDYCTPKMDNSDGLPSWVPDWREIGRQGATVESIDIGLEDNATVGIPQPMDITDERKGGYFGVLSRLGCRVDVVTEVMQAPPKLANDELNSYAPSYLSSTLEFAGLGPESGPGEDFVWRTLIGRGFGEINGKSCRLYEWISGDIALLVRMIMRQEQLDPDHLTPNQVDFINEGPLSLGWTRPDLKTPQEQLTNIVEEWPSTILYHNESRTLFKTIKGMFGRGHVVIRPGDLVTLLWGVKVPIVLRPRNEGGFTFVGDAYVDGIMNGEFLETSPAHEMFDIY